MLSIRPAARIKRGLSALSADEPHLTTMKATPKQLLDQYLRVQGNDWLVYFEQAAKTGKTSVSHVLGIGSRETNLKNIRGDKRNGIWNGFGVMQVDIKTDPEYARNWSPSNARAGIIRGGEIYAAKVADTKASVGKVVKVRSKKFTGRAVDAADLRRVATAAYNCGRWAHYHFSKFEHVDTTTTGDDYSRDVYDRAIHFAAMLQGQTIRTKVVKKKTVCELADDARLSVIDPNALATEVRLQGRYCRPEHAALVGKTVAARESLPVGVAMASLGDLKQVDFHHNVDEIAEAPAPEPEENAESQKNELPTPEEGDGQNNQVVISTGDAGGEDQKLQIDQTNKPASLPGMRPGDAPIDAEGVEKPFWEKWKLKFAGVFGAGGLGALFNFEKLEAIIAKFTSLDATVLIWIFASVGVLAGGFLGFVAVMKIIHALGEYFLKVEEMRSLRDPQSYNLRLVAAARQQGEEKRQENLSLRQ